MSRDYFGHEENVRALSETLPAVSLFIGPQSVGKWELAEWLREQHRVKSADTLRVKRLTQENAKFVARWSVGAPQGNFRLVICRLDRAVAAALNTLLKTLEESKSTRFILVSESAPLATIRSRAEVFDFGLLDEDSISSILQVQNGFSPEVASQKAQASRGRVRNALEHSKHQNAKVVVLKALEATVRKEYRTLEQVALIWQQEHTDLLVTWCYEAITKKWTLFEEDETLIRGTGFPLKVLMLLRDDLRPRLVVRAVLAAMI